MSDAALALDGVFVRYEGAERDALSDVSFAQARGGMVGVLGASGAGKSTLLKSIARIVPELQRASVRGRVRVLGRDAGTVTIADLSRDIGFVFQDFEAQIFSTSVLDEVVFALEQSGVSPPEMAGRVRESLEAVELSGFEGRDPTALSGGEKQRLAIAAVLAAHPSLLLLDEPSTDLDPAGRRQIFSLLAGLRRAGATLVVAEHDLESLAVADHLLLLDEGRIAASGPPREMFAKPETLERFGVRPPELALVAARFGVGAPFDLDGLERSLRGRGSKLQVRARQAAPRPEGPPLLEARGVRHRYPQSSEDALRGVDFEIRRGERVALVGSNGSGKSTLARHLNALLRAKSGEVRWQGRPIDTLSAAERASAIGYVFQNPDEQIFAATVGEEVAFGPVQLRLPAEEIAGRVERALEAVGLEGRTDRDPFLLGKGERQRVAVASVLALEPAVLILDEPTTGLDFAEQRLLLGVLSRLNEQGMAIIVITHVPWVVASFATRAILMSEGKILWDGGVRELCADPELCRQGDFLPPEVTRLGSRFGLTPLSVDELVSAS